MNLSESLIIGAPREELFSLTQDYTHRLSWDPFLMSAELLDGAAEPGVGVRGVFLTMVMGWKRNTSLAIPRKSLPSE